MCYIPRECQPSLCRCLGFLLFSLKPGKPQEESTVSTYSPAKASTHLASIADTNTARMENSERWAQPTLFQDLPRRYASLLSQALSHLQRILNTPTSHHKYNFLAVKEKLKGFLPFCFCKFLAMSNLLSLWSPILGHTRELLHSEKTPTYNLLSNTTKFL